MLVGDRTVDRMFLGIAMMMHIVPVMDVLAIRDPTRKRVWRMLSMKRMLRSVHEHDGVLIGQNETQRHAKHDG